MTIGVKLAITGFLLGVAGFVCLFFSLHIYYSDMRKERVKKEKIRRAEFEELIEKYK